MKANILLAHALVLAGGACASHAPRSSHEEVRQPTAERRPATRAEFATELTRRAREVNDKGWPDAHRARVVQANTAAGLAPTPEQLAAQLEAWRTELLSRIFDSMRRVAAPEHLKLAFEIASDSSAPLQRRELALKLLDVIVLPTDAVALARREALRGELAARERVAPTDAANDLTRVVAAMRAPFRRCYQEQLARSRGDYRGFVAFEVQPSGEPSTVTVSELPSEMVPCIEAVVLAARFLPTAEARKVRLPLTLVDQTDSGNAPALHACFEYEPATVELTGTLERRDYPGPPNYESIARGDVKEVTWLLRLDRQACTLDSADSTNPGRLGLTIIQLVFSADPGAYDKYRPLMGKHIVAHGQLFAAQTGHHHTGVLLTVSDLAAAN